MLRRMRPAPRLYNLSQHHFHEVPQIHAGDSGAKGFENFQYGVNCTACSRGV